MSCATFAAARASQSSRDGTAFPADKKRRSYLVWAVYQYTWQVELDWNRSRTAFNPANVATELLSIEWTMPAYRDWHSQCRSMSWPSRDINWAMIQHESLVNKVAVNHRESTDHRPWKTDVSHIWNFDLFSFRHWGWVTYGLAAARPQ